MAFIIIAILFTQFISSSVMLYHGNQFMDDTYLLSHSHNHIDRRIYSQFLPLLKWFIRRRRRQGYHRHHLLVYNINLYYNQSNSLRIKRDIFPSLQNKWSHVNTMHQCDILFEVWRKYNIIIYVVLLALKAYRPFSRMAKSNIYPKYKSPTRKYNEIPLRHLLPHTHSRLYLGVILLPHLARFLLLLQTIISSF